MELGVFDTGLVGSLGFKEKALVYIGTLWRLSNIVCINEHHVPDSNPLLWRYQKFPTKVLLIYGPI